MYQSVTDIIDQNVCKLETLCMDYIYKLLGHVERDNYFAYNTSQTNILIRWFNVFFTSFVKRDEINPFTCKTKLIMTTISLFKARLRINITQRPGKVRPAVHPYSFGKVHTQ